MYYPSRITLAQTPTPLDRLERLPAARPLWCKRDDLTGSALSGNKVRKLEFVLADALERGADTLITCGGLQSNHCRATALIAARHGLNCQLVLRGDPTDVPDGNWLLADLAGAEIACYPAPTYKRDLAGLLEQHRQQWQAAGHSAYVIPTGASDGVGIWGYIAAAEELAVDMNRAGLERALVVCPAGSGGTLAGLSLGLSVFAPQARVLGVAVCDSAAYFERRVREDIERCCERYGLNYPQPQNFEVSQTYIGEGYGVGYPAVYQTMRELARYEGLVLDPVYTGKAFYGMLDLMNQGHWPDRDWVFVHTGGIFGVFPEREALARHS